MSEDEKAGAEAGEELAPLGAELAPTPEEAELPGGFFGAVAEVILRSIFFYPGITALGMTLVGFREGWTPGPLAVAAFWAATLLWGACMASNAGLDAVAGEAAPGDDIDTGPTIFGQLFQGIFSVVDLGMGDDGDGCLGVLATFGITLVLFFSTLALGLISLPVLGFAFSPSWLRAALVLVPPLPLTSLFALVTYVRLRRRQRARDLRLAAVEAEREAAAAALPEESAE